MPKQEFDSYVIKGSDENSCWLWAGKTTSDGYGRYHIAKGHTDIAHRIMYERTYGACLHNLARLCDTRLCVNPSHMEAWDKDSRDWTPRFWSKVNKTDTCWLWTAYVNVDGYGQFAIKGKVVGAHRVAYKQLVGDIPDGLVLDHECHVRNCVNPEHLRPANHLRNATNRKGARADNTTGIRGVGLHRLTGKYRARAMSRGKSYDLGLFEAIGEADKAVRKLRAEIHE